MTPIRVRAIDKDKLLGLAIRHYNAYGRHQDWFEPASRSSQSDFLERITVNFVRHELTSYDRLWNRLVGKVGRQATHGLLRARVLGAIAATYPHLAAECDRQVERAPAEDALFARGRW